MNTQAIFKPQSTPKSKMAGADSITPQHLKKVADSIIQPRPLGIELGIPNEIIDKLIGPLEGTTQYGAKMLNIWHAGQVGMTATKLKESLVKALEAVGRNDIAEEVTGWKLQTENDRQRLFQHISGKVTTKWKEFGIELGMPFDDIDAVGAAVGPANNAVLQMLQMWQQRTAPNVQCTELISALKALHREDIVEALDDVDGEYEGSLL